MASRGRWRLGGFVPLEGQGFLVRLGGLGNVDVLGTGHRKMP